VLAVQLGAPPVGLGMPRAVVAMGPRCADFGDGDAESAEDEAPTTEVDSLLPPRGQAPRLASPRRHRLPGIVPAWALHTASAARRVWRARSGEPTGHFLAAGRPFRSWIQSLTC
jgi:hypothetical protein